MFQMLKLKFFQNNTNEKMTVRTNINLCQQGPEQDLTEYFRLMDSNFAQYNDMGAEVPEEDTRFIVTTQLNARFWDLAKGFTTRTPDLEYSSSVR